MAAAICSHLERSFRGELAPAVPYVLFVTLREQMDAALGSQRVMAAMSIFFAGMALLLSGLGLYGLMSSSVTQRTAEIGVRMALGAPRIRVLCMVMREAMTLLVAGLILGSGLLVVGLRFVEKMLYGVTAFEPMQTVFITCVLAMVAAFAALIPALRAASVDPIRALRD